MPLYEYRCRDCGVRFERIEKASAPKDGRCPECGGNAPRMIGAPALQFKGSGWYVTDYGKGNGPASSETEAPSAADATATPTGEKRSDSKSGKKSAPKVA